MGQDDRLREARRAGGELDVDRVERPEAREDPLQFPGGNAVGGLVDLPPEGEAPRRARRRAGCGGVVEHDAPQQRQLPTAQRLRRRPGQLGQQAQEHRGVVARAERRDREDPLHLGPRERVRQLAGAVGRVDVDEHGADARRGHLQELPLEVVRRPDADALPGPETGAEQAAREAIDGGRELRIAQAAPLEERDGRLARAVLAGDSREMCGDRIGEERFLAGAPVVARALHDQRAGQQPAAVPPRRGERSPLQKRSYTSSRGASTPETAGGQEHFLAFSGFRPIF